ENKGEVGESHRNPVHAGEAPSHRSRPCDVTRLHSPSLTAPWQEMKRYAAGFSRGMKCEAKRTRAGIMRGRSSRASKGARRRSFSAAHRAKKLRGEMSSPMASALVAVKLLLSTRRAIFKRLHAWQARADRHFTRNARRA